MASVKRNFVLTDQDQARLAALQADTGCTAADAVRHGLIALRTLMSDGFSFKSTPGDDVIRRGPDGTLRFFKVEGDALVPAGAVWTAAS